MKKILLGSTVLVGAAALFAGAAFAGETPKVTLGGTSDFQVGFVGEDQDGGPADGTAGSPGGNKRAGAFRTETQLDVKVDGKTDSGLGYGAQFDLAVSGTDNADSAAGNAGANGSQVNHSWIYLDGAWGRLEGGSTVGVTSTMKVDASKIARATGGIDGDFHYFMTATSGRVIATPDLALDYGAAQLGDETTEAINKVNYYTPRFAGFQAGVSYLFDNTAADKGIFLSRGSRTAGEVGNIVLGGLNYEGKFDAIGFKAAATGEWGNSETIATNDLRTWNVGAEVDYMGFSVAGSYGDLSDSLQPTATAADSGTHYWTLGGAYVYGPFGASVTYLNSRVDTGATHNDFDNLSIGADYKLAPGLTPYAEVSFVSLDPTGVVNDNDATVFIAGTQVSF